MEKSISTNKGYRGEFRMLTTINVSNKQANQLANALNEIYWAVEVEGAQINTSFLYKDIACLVESNVNSVQKIRANNPTLAYRISSTRELAEEFLKKYNTIINKSMDYAYSINRRFGHTIDIVSVVCPYVMYLLEITDETYSFYIGLGLAISNIICDALSAEKEKRLEAEETSEKVEIFKALISLLEKSKRYNKNPQIENSLKSIRSLLNYYENNIE